MAFELAVNFEQQNNDNEFSWKCHIIGQWCVSPREMLFSCSFI